MLWACELKPRSWWTENLNVVRICVELLHTLSVWLTDIRCPHYFINNCNLLDNSFNVGSVASKLMSIDEGYLSTWLMNNYIGQCAQLGPLYLLRLFNDVSSSVKLQNVVSAVVLWRQNTSLYKSWWAIEFAEFHIASLVSMHSLTTHSCVVWMNELAKIYEHFSLYFSGVALLHVACKMSRNGFNDELMDIVAIVLGRNYNQCCSALCVRKTELNTSELVELLQKSAVEHLTTFRQLVARDFGSVATIATTDFEALYAYKRGDYQQCLQLSTQNVHTLLYEFHMLGVPTYPEFIRLLDDDIVSMTALLLIVNPEYRHRYSTDTCIAQLTLSLYLMTQCQLNLHQSVWSLAETLDYIKVAKRKIPCDCVLDQLTLKLTERKAAKPLDTGIHFA